MDKKVTETFQLSRLEQLELRNFRSELLLVQYQMQDLQRRQQVLQQQFQTYANELVKTYSENGTYKVVGAIDERGFGERERIKFPAIPEPIPEPLPEIINEE